MNIKKTLICLVILSTLHTSASADVTDKALVGGVTLGLVAATGIIVQDKLQKNGSPINLLSTSKEKILQFKINNLLQDSSILSKAKLDSDFKQKKINEINQLLKNDKVDINDKELLLSLKQKLEEKDKYIEKNSPYYQDTKNAQANTDYPVSDFESQYILTNPITGEKFNASTEFPLTPLRSYEEYLTQKSNSQELAKNMGGAQKGLAAHHIVPVNGKDAQQARDILKKHGIDINDAVNGVFLPMRNNTSNTTGIIHNGRHPNIYLEKINIEIFNADKIGGKNGVINKLSEIKNYLLQASGKKWKNLL